MMKLYFEHSNGVQDYLCEVIDINDGVRKAIEDLNTRAPHFKSYYQRINEYDNGEYVIDVGDHLCYYVIKSE